MSLPDGRVSAQLTKESEARAQAAAEAEKKLREDLRVVFGNSGPAGVRVLRYLKDLCGWDASPLTADPQSYELHEKAMVNNVARQNVYRTFRSKVPVELLIRAEFNQGEENDG